MFSAVRANPPSADCSTLIRFLPHSPGQKPLDLKESLEEGRRVYSLSLGSSSHKNFRCLVALGNRLIQAGVEEVSVEGADYGFALGSALGSLAWGNEGFRTREKARPELAVFCAEFAEVQKGFELSECVNFARTLGFTPPNIATPKFMAETAKQLAADCGMSYREIDLVAERMEGLINVGKASENKPYLVRLEYNPGATGQPVVLVGKTITYDTGGLSLKPREGMVGMKTDKNGGCAVLGAMRHIAMHLKPNVRVVALICAAENSVSSNAYRPDDVLTYRNGTTVEVTNTDAEGRLVLADGLIWACEVENPQCVVDIATLTGGVVTALGKAFAGLFCNDEPMAAELEAAGRTTGDRLWRLPLDADYSEMMKSPIADLQNSNANRLAHPCQGAAFLEAFVSEGVRWAHIDIAGVSRNESDKSPNGFGVSLLSHFVAAQALDT